MIVVVVVEVVVVQCGCRCGRIGLAVVVGVIHFVVDRSWTTRTELKTSKFYPVNVKWHFLMNFFLCQALFRNFISFALYYHVLKFAQPRPALLSWPCVIGADDFFQALA